MSETELKLECLRIVAALRVTEERVLEMAEKIYNWITAQPWAARAAA